MLNKSGAEGAKGMVKGKMIGSLWNSKYGDGLCRACSLLEDKALFTMSAIDSARILKLQQDDFPPNVERRDINARRP